MSQIALVVLLGGLSSATSLGEDKKIALSQTEQLRELKRDFDESVKQFFAARNKLASELQTTKDENRKAELKQQLTEWIERFPTDRPITRFGPKLLRLAETEPHGTAGVEALDVVLREEWRINAGPKGKDRLWEQAVQILHKHYVKVPEVRPLLPLLSISRDPAGQGFVRKVMEKNPDRLTQAMAVRWLANFQEVNVELLRRIQKDTVFRLTIAASEGKETVEKMLASIDESQAELTRMRELLRDKYSDLLPDLTIGQKVSHVSCRDLDGKEVKLGDYEGKVVVLDFWTTSCGACLTMIPKQRELVKKLRDKPFVLINISADSQREDVEKFLKKQPMPWTHWWCGQDGPILERMNVYYYPTIYVLDAKGVIRYKDRNGEFPDDELEAAVNALLKEVEK